jgi:hypothetical protein
MTDTSSGSGRDRPRRPALFSNAAMDSLAGSPDPARVAEAAHATAAAIVETGRSTTDPETTSRLVKLVDEHGIDTIADLWAGRPARSLPGALWRMYVLREWVRRDPVGASLDYRAGRDVAEVPHVVAGVAEPPGPDEMQQLVDAVLTGVYRGELDVALERGAAFCRVVAAGRALRADDDPDDLSANVLTRRAASLQHTAEDLEHAARSWRAHALR